MLKKYVEQNTYFSSNAAARDPEGENFTIIHNYIIHDENSKMT